MPCAYCNKNNRDLSKACKVKHNARTCVFNPESSAYVHGDKFGLVENLYLEMWGVPKHALWWGCQERAKKIPVVVESEDEDDCRPDEVFEIECLQCEKTFEVECSREKYQKGDHSQFCGEKCVEEYKKDKDVPAVPPFHCCGCQTMLDYKIPVIAESEVPWFLGGRARCLACK